MTTTTQPGAYGIEEDPNGKVQCGECGKRWAEDITPAGRCPWEDEHEELETVSAFYTLEDLDGTDDEADWLQAGHVLDADEVNWLRSLRITR